ncbi:MAG: polysaccharide pyruvyl transferase family protein [Bacteroidaceae bacterium]|nr:polysaccharide pyruvyl transferase family protein [Bacteroidaceae bacterium]
MKIGILTFHTARNYGAVLQCYALQETLKQLGHDVEIIDYRQKWIESIYTTFSFHVLAHRKGLRNKLQYLKNANNRRLRNKRFSGFVKHNLQLSEPCNTEHNIPQSYDYYIIGSDQLWSTICLGGTFDPVYWGDFCHPKNSRIIGYAISLDKGSIDQIVSKKIPLFSNFSSLSLRESSAIESFKSISTLPLRLAIDPTLLCKSTIWEGLINHEYKDRKYIVLYQVRYPIERTLLFKKSRRLALQYGYELIILYPTQYTVEDFISIIKYAQCVITSSFHATVFSLVFGTPFYTYNLNDGRDDRNKDLLEQVGCLDRAVEISFEPKKIIPLNKQMIDANLEIIRKSSLEFLTSSLK